MTTYAYPSHEQLQMLSDERDDAVHAVTEKMLELLSPTVGAAVDRMFNDAPGINYRMSDVLIFEEALVVAVDLHISNVDALKTHTLIGQLIEVSPDVASGESRYTSMHVSIPLEMAFSTAEEIVAFISEQPVVTNKHHEDGTVDTTSTADLELTEDQQRRLVTVPTRLQ